MRYALTAGCLCPRSATAELVGRWQHHMKNWPDYLPVLPPGLTAKVQNLPVSTGKGNGDLDEVTAEL